MKAVIYTDMFQVTVMLIGFLALLIQAMIKVGGLQNTLDAAERTNKISFLE